MNFVLLMALREIRASWRRLLFFFVCVAIGVGAIVVLRSVIQTVREHADARGARAASAPTSSSAPTVRGRRSCARISTKRLRAGARLARQETIDVATMVRPAGGEGRGGRADGGAARRRRPASRSTARSSCRTAASSRTRCSRAAACWSGRSCSRSSASPVGDRAAHRRPAVHHPRRDRAGARAPGRRASASARA